MAIETGVGEGPTVLCGWCSKLLQLGRGPVSHGICKPCHEEYFPGVPFQGDEAVRAQGAARG